MTREEILDRFKNKIKRDRSIFENFPGTDKIYDLIEFMNLSGLESIDIRSLGLRDSGGNFVSKLKLRKNNIYTFTDDRHDEIDWEKRNSRFEEIRPETPGLDEIYRFVFKEKDFIEIKREILLGQLKNIPEQQLWYEIICSLMKYCDMVSSLEQLDIDVAPGVLKYSHKTDDYIKTVYLNHEYLLLDDDVPVYVIFNDYKGTDDERFVSLERESIANDFFVSVKDLEPEFQKSVLEFMLSL